MIFSDSTNAALPKRRLLGHTAFACVLLFGCALLVFPPAYFAFYPRCPIHEYFGILCPGCGATRALAALLRGHVAEALRLNALFVSLLPFALVVAIRAYIRAIRPGEFRWPRIPAPALGVTLFAAVAFTIARNLAR